MALIDDRLGSFEDSPLPPFEVRLISNSGHWRSQPPCYLSTRAPSPAARLTLPGEVLRSPPAEDRRGLQRVRLRRRAPLGLLASRKLLASGNHLVRTDVGPVRPALIVLGRPDVVGFDRLGADDLERLDLAEELSQQLRPEKREGGEADHQDRQET